MAQNTLSTQSMKTWLTNHQACVDAGVNVGEINLAKARVFRLELLHRELRTR